LAGRRSSAILSVLTIKISKILKDGGWKIKNRHILAGVRPIPTKFDMAMQYGHVERSDL